MRNGRIIIGATIVLGAVAVGAGIWNVEGGKCTTNDVGTRCSLPGEMDSGPRIDLTLRKDHTPYGESEWLEFFWASACNDQGVPEWNEFYWVRPADGRWPLFPRLSEGSGSYPAGCEKQN